VPTLNQYKDNTGYYIRAWTTDIGNITYKLKSESNSIIKDCGFNHGDEISWEVIKSLKSIGLVYTNKSGIIEVGEFEPEPGQAQENPLSKRQAKALLEAIQKYHNLSESIGKYLFDSRSRGARPQQQSHRRRA
jgi:hypothetical protein